MSIYHLKTTVGSHAGGQSASAKDDYIEREGRYSGDRSEVEHVESGHMPGWAEEDAHAYWEAADAYERANGRLFREVEFALPTELTRSGRVEVAREFAHFLTGRERLPYTLAIHRGGGENPHCHLVISERANDGLERTAATWFKRYNGKAPERGGARKVSTSSKEWLKSTREAWAEHANRALARAGSSERIDHRSLSDRAEEAREAGDLERAAELSREPGKHLGPGAAIEAKFLLGQGKSPSSAVAEAGEIEERNDRWANRWETVNEELSRVQEDLGQLMEELRGVERAIRAMAKKVSDRARQVFSRRPAGGLIRGAFRPSQEPQPERGGSSRELPEKPRDRDMCR
jgi:hypothetical protein